MIEGSLVLTGGPINISNAFEFPSLSSIAGMGLGDHSELELELPADAKVLLK